MCLLSIRLEGGLFVDHSVRTVMGAVRHCAGSGQKNRENEIA